MLTGTLDTFSVGEILSLLGASETSGALHVWSADDEGTIFCRDGEVTSATVGPGDDVGRVLVRSGFVDASEWSEVLVAPEPVDRLAETFDRSGVDTGRVHRFLATQTEESVFELDGWQSGELRFEPEADHCLGGYFRYPTRQLLASLEARRAEWDPLIAKVGSVDRIVHQAPFNLDDEEMRISRTQLMMVSHIDGRRSVRELARFLGTGLFQTCKVISSLVDARLVSLGDEPAAASGRDEPGDHALPSAPGESVDGAVDASRGGGSPVNGSVQDGPAEEATDFVEPGDGPARDLIVRLLSAVKEEL